MATAFTIYWTPEGWNGVGEGNLIRFAAGSGFVGRINSGDRVFVTNVSGGRLRLLGAFEVDRIQDTATEGKPAGATWDGREYLIAKPGTSTLLRFIEVTPDDVRRLTFVGKTSTVALTEDGAVDRQAMRAIRELTADSAARLETLLLEHDASASVQGHSRLPVSTLQQATPQHIWWAVQALVAGQAQHTFGESTDYDLITDEGERLAPKAVFGVALARALDREIGPEHFTAGVGSPCFRLLTVAGFEIVPKGSAPTEVPDTGASDVDEWDEGAKKLVVHLRGERKRGLARAKKADFRDRNDGRLFCERCSKDPVVEYGSEHGEACIEVHHATTQIAAMTEGAKTRLEDLQCLCANCHRIVHRRLRLGLAT